MVVGYGMNFCSGPRKINFDIFGHWHVFFNATMAAAAANTWDRGPGVYRDSVTNALFLMLNDKQGQRVAYIPVIGLTFIIPFSLHGTLEPNISFKEFILSPHFDVTTLASRPASMHALLDLLLIQPNVSPRDKSIFQLFKDELVRAAQILHSPDHETALARQNVWTHIRLGRVDSRLHGGEEVPQTSIRWTRRD